MSVLVLILLISLIMENSGSSPRYLVTSSPNWNHIYTGDPVTLTCDTGPEKNSNKDNFIWFKDNKEMNQQKQKFYLSEAKSSDSGVYECWTGSGDRSHPLTIYVIQKDVKNRPTVTFNPNYRNIFAGEKMTISCEDGSYATRNQRYVWYKNNKILDNDQKFITIIKANSNDSGEYRCGRGRRDSYPLRLHVHPIYDEVILQTPPNILEGDPLDVRCHSYPHYSNKEEDGTFYKDGDIIQKSNQILHLENVTKSTTGIYRCEKIVQTQNSKLEETFMFVQDLFTRPEIKAHSDIKEGEVLTLRCDTRCNPLREDTELTFTFYRNGETVQELRSHDTYTVQTAQGKDSGKYTCTVRTLSDTVMKRSDELFIRIIDPVTGITLGPDKDNSIQWIIIGVPALVFILVVVLLVMCRKKMSARCCHKKPPSTGMDMGQNDQDMDKEYAASDSEGIYVNVSSRDEVAVVYSTIGDVISETRRTSWK
ncbi:high affinity immunoglobulin gamma Fc receptor I-like isoform X2 [Hyla sarda]|uniref:high affinity immunoglobulin gamma Fc receptor I-like isoform X2 n=1 Tax=Hyla sarda TaxID=327740 RepID=UPI0024C32D82|nr:high affinity immunoglobulin gamma Fc receptor I-like isoform X2 [Hyla sarda]